MNSSQALSLSDMDATYFELEQAALERSLSSYKQNEHEKKQSAALMNSNTSIKPDYDDHKAPAVSLSSTASVAAKGGIGVSKIWLFLFPSFDFWFWGVIMIFFSFASQ